MLQDLLEQEIDIRKFAKENLELWNNLVKEINNIIPVLKNNGEWEN